MTTRRKITVSSGDMALILGRYKSGHYMRLPEDEALEPGDVIDIEQKRSDGSSFSIPVIVTESAPIHSNRPLNALEEWRVGRVSQKTPASPSLTVSKQRWNVLMRDVGKRIAKQFVAHAESALPAELYPDDIAGDASSHPIHRFSFALKRMPDEVDSLDSLCRRFKAAYDEQEPRVSYAHAYRFNNNGKDGEFLSPPRDPSDLWAIRFLERHHRPVELEKILTRLREPYEQLRQLNRAINQSRPHYIPAADPDGINKVLAGLPSIPCPLDTGSLAMMGAITHIAVRHPLPEPASTREALTAILYATGRGTAHSAHRLDFQVPVEVDTRPDSARIFHSSAIDTAIAKEHGFTTPKDMRAGLGLTQGEECTLASYPFTLARAEALPLDPDRAGKAIIRQKQGALNALEQKGESRKRATRFLGTLSLKERLTAEANITPPGDYTPEMLDLLGPPELNAAGTRQLPNDVLARKAANGTPPAPKRKPSNKSAQKPKREITLHGGFDDLAKAVAKAEKRDAPTPPRLQSHSPAKAKAAEPGISPIFVTSEEILSEHHMERHSNREGIDKDGVPIIAAPTVPEHKTLATDARQLHIERAREAKKPRDKKPLRGVSAADASLSRRERLRRERHRTGETMRDLQRDPGQAQTDAPQHESWQDFLLEAPPSRSK